MDLSLIELQTPGVKRFTPDSEGAMALSRSVAKERTSLGDALDRTWDWDAFFVGYRVVDEDGDLYHGRVNKTAVASFASNGARVEVTTLALDYDLPGHEAWTDENIAEFLEVVPGLFEGTLPAPTAVYSTRAGARFVYTLSRPVSPGDAEELLAGLIATYNEVGIEVDEACKDWTRLFRLPKVTRDGVVLDPWVNNWDDAVTYDVESARRVQVSSTTYSDVEVALPDSMPTVGDVDEIMVENGGKSQFAKAAKKWFGKDFSEGSLTAILFEGAPIVRGETNWDAESMAFIGRVCKVTAPRTTIQHTFALMYEPFQALQVREDMGQAQRLWLAWAWDRLQDIWVKEQQSIASDKERLEAERAAEDARAQAAEAKLEGMVQGIFDQMERRNDITARARKFTREEKLEWVRSRLIAKTGDNEYRLMEPDGQYSRKTFQKNEFHSMIRGAGMDDLISLRELRGRDMSNKDEQNIFRDHGVAPQSVLLTTETDFVEVFGGPESDLYFADKLYEHSALLRPVFHQEVDAWLRKLVGDNEDHYVALNEWLSHAPDHRRPIAALSLSGGAGCGKTLLGLALAEIWEGGARGDQRALGKFNGSLIDTPLIFLDEGLPDTRAGDESMDFASTFKQYVSGGKITLRAMYKNAKTITTNPRLLFAANDGAVLRALAKTAENDDQTDALGERLLHFEIPRTAAEYLRSRGGRNFTEGWIGTSAKPGLIAEHIMWLFRNRGPVAPGARFLVEGNAQQLFRKAMLEDGVMPKVAQVFVEAIAVYAKDGVMPPGFLLDNEGFWVQAEEFRKKLMPKMGFEDMSARKVSATLRDHLGGGAPSMQKRLGNGSRARMCKLSYEKVLTLLYVQDLDAEPLEGILRDSLPNADQVIRDAAAESL